MAGVQFKFPKQLKEVLFEKLELTADENRKISRACPLRPRSWKNARPARGYSKNYAVPRIGQIAIYLFVGLAELVNKRPAGCTPVITNHWPPGAWVPRIKLAKYPSAREERAVKFAGFVAKRV